jgi:sugar/nucleoside kinase (ribokinase family)
MPTEDAQPRDVRDRRPGYDLLVLGDCNPDLVLAGEAVQAEFGQVERLVDSADLTIGGSAGITACGAARLGLRTALVGVVGDDVFGHFMLDALAERGVDTGGVVVDPAARTGLTVILSRPGDRAILTFPGTISALTAPRVDGDLLASARHIHVAAFFLQTALVPGLPKLFERARAAGATTSIDPNWDPEERWDGGLERLLGQTDVFLPNAEEAMRIADIANIEEAACALAARGPLVAVKRGEHGALAARASGELVEIEAVRGTAPVDTIGAGDSFDAGFLTALLNGWSTRWALALGSACGSLSTRATGGTPAQPMLAEAEEAVAVLLEAR